MALKAKAKAAAPRKRFGRRHKLCSICGKPHAPWWASAKGRWMLDVKQPDGSYIRKTLGPDHNEALIRWHQIEAGLETVEPETTAAKPVVFQPSGTGDAILIGELAGIFLTKLEARIGKKISKERYGITERYIKEFVRGFGAMPIAALRVGGVEKIEDWMDEHKSWGSRADVVSRIRQLFNWGVTHGYIATSPVKALEKPKFGQRVTWFTAEQVNAILANCNEHFARGFRLLIFTGCRPDEICSLEASNVFENEATKKLFLLVNHKNIRHTGKPRRVYLPSEAEEIVREQLKKYPTDRLLRSGNRTSDGVPPPLSPEYFDHALRDVCAKPECEALGLNKFEWVISRNKKGEVIKKKKYDYVPYTCRHTAAVRWLTGFYPKADGTTPNILHYGEVAALLGNTAKMVEQIYGHLVDQTAFLTARLSGAI